MSWEDYELCAPDGDNRGDSQTVVVTDVTGRQTKGSVDDVGPSSLTIRVPEQITFNMDEVLEVRRTDSIWSGVQIGFWTGIATMVAGVGILAATTDPDRDSALGWAMYCFYVYPSVGAVAGGLVGHRTGNERVYQRPRQTQAFTFTPLRSRRGHGLAVSLSF